MHVWYMHSCVSQGLLLEVQKRVDTQVRVSHAQEQVAKIGGQMSNYNGRLRSPIILKKEPPVITERFLISLE